MSGASQSALTAALLMMAATAKRDRTRALTEGGSSPLAMAAAYIIRADCEAHGWERTITEIAASTGMPGQRVMKILALKNWTQRTRRAHRSTHDADTMITRHDAALDALWGDRDWTNAA